MLGSDVSGEPQITSEPETTDAEPRIFGILGNCPKPFEGGI